MTDLPSILLDTAASHLGASVIDTTALEGGYTAQRLLRLHLADGRTAVLKGASPHPEGASGPKWGETLKREITAYHTLDQLRDWMPRHLGDFEQDDWQVLLLEDLGDARRVPPWDDQTLELVASGLAAMHRSTLGSAPSPGHFRFFQSIEARGRIIGDLPEEYDHPEWWAWLEEATIVGEQALLSLGPDTPRSLVHFDVRSDNLFLRENRLILIDWPDAMWQTPAVDSVYWALGVEIETGRDARMVHDLYRRQLPELDEAAIRYTLAFCLGCFIDSSQKGGAPARLVDVRRRFIAATAPWFCDLCGIRPMPRARKRQTNRANHDM